MRKRGPVVFAGVMVTLFATVFGIIYATRNFGKSAKVVDAESAEVRLSALYNGINPTVAKPVKDSVDTNDSLDEAAELPDIDTYEIVVDGGDDAVEIWASGEKAGVGTDGWMRQMVSDWNSEHDAKLSLRSVPSGIAVDYIATGKAKPSAYSPSNELWTNILAACDVKVETIAARTVGNLAGIAIDKTAAERIKSEYSTLDLGSVVDAVIDGKLTLGYTNPNTSAAGLNLLASVLDRFGGDDPTSDEAISKFSEFQANIPFVSMTTQQMRDAAQRGSLEGFVTELQVYQLDDALQRNYEFVPFGWRHDNPLVAVGSVNDLDMDTLRQFAAYCDKNGDELAKRDGFGERDSYKTDTPAPDGAMLLRELAAYKDAKDAGSPVVAVFVCDTSGSMNGAPMTALKTSLLNSMQYVGKNNYVGLVSFSDDVTINLRLDKFDINQQALFKGAVNSLDATGSTATVDGIIVGAKMISDKVAELSDAKPMLFVLSDGQQNRGNSLSTVSGALKALRIPVYTIAYGDACDMGSLQAISDINEASVISTDTDDIVYQLKNLFNANL